MTLERLIGDGRIHPARIETVEKCRHELELQMKREGERAVMELGIHGLHPDLIKLIGRLKYRTSFGQNALTHSMEVAWVARPAGRRDGCERDHGTPCRSAA